jgi:hypothetical protein
VQVFTDDKEELARAILRSGQRVAASEIVHGESAPADRPEKPNAPTLLERVKARALEIARAALTARREREAEDGARFGVALGGWPARDRKPGLEPGR